MIHLKSMILLSTLLLVAPDRPTTSVSSPQSPDASALTGAEDPCGATAFAARRARKNEVRGDYFIRVGNCLNLTDPTERDECMTEALEDLYEDLEEAEEQFEARLVLCALLGGGAYDPPIDPSRFVKGIDNPYFPLAPGSTRTYEKQLPTSTETVVITVTDDTRTFLGVECVVVRETESEDGEVGEDTFDYFAQDVDGNVWYFGEISMEFEDGFLASLDGSWETGRDGAKPGIVMLADPAIGATYRQEFFLGDAEDAGTVLSRSASVVVPFGAFDDCVQTSDFSPLEPGNEEHKFYAAGIGLVLEFDPANGERLELISVTP